VGFVLAQGRQLSLWGFITTEYFAKYGQPVIGAGPR
jgi:hypothetical protein